MRYTVTALGSAGDRPVGVVIGTIARYLIAPEPSPETPGAPSPGSGDGEGSVVRYYAERGDKPGRWLGQGAQELGLAGEVDFDDFTSVLAGRDPRTGARLITARGSAGRVASLGTLTVARWGPNGEALYSVRDAARILGWTQAGVRAATAGGERLAASRLFQSVTGTGVSAGTRTAGTTGNGLGSGVGRDRNTGSRTPAPARRPATGSANGTARTAPGRTSADSTDTAATVVPAGTRRGTDREPTGQRSRRGPGRAHPHIGTERHTGARPGRHRRRTRAASPTHPGQRDNHRQPRR